VGSPASSKNKLQESLSGRTKAIVIGLILAIIGSLIASSFSKDSITNYTGFGMLLAGIAILVLGVSATAATSLKIRLSRETPSNLKVRKPTVLFFSVWTAGVGTVLAVIGFLLSSQFADSTIVNIAGYHMLQGGGGVLLVGAFGILVSTAKIHRVKKAEFQTAFKSKRPGRRLVGGLLIGIGIAVTVAGSVVAGSYAKETVLNYTGFGALLTGVAILSAGISQSVIEVLKERWNLEEYCIGKNAPRIVLGSIWAICIGSMLIANGSLIASSYAKSSLMNYAGFGMLLAGTGVFVYGLFETARISATSAMGYLNNKRAHVVCEPKKKEKLSVRWRNSGKNLVKTSAVFNLAGVMTALGLLFFSLWQLDLIVSGPVWWQASANGVGWHWDGPGAYANDYFQCFLWKTTIGQAYDTLFMLIFISFIVLFASAFFWPRMKTKDMGNSA
jgi:hypothetical protein